GDEADDGTPFAERRASRNLDGLGGGEPAAEVDVGGEGDDPGEHHAEEGAAENVFEGFGGGPALEHEGDDDSVGRGEQGQGWSAFCAEAAERAGSPTGTGEREEHARRDVESGIGSGEGGGQDYEIHEMSGARKAHGTEDGDERAFGDAGAVPGHDPDQNDDGA